MNRVERLALAVLLGVFTWFTWRGMTMHYSGDDMMNMHFATSLNPWRLAKSVVLFWVPVYRPLGGVIYAGMYSIFGFNPTPLNILCWLILAVNVVLAYRFFKVITGVVSASFVALAVTLIHPTFQDLYVSAGTIYDRLWYLFTVLGLTLYARWRHDGLTLPRQAMLVLLSILSMASKESGVALPVLMGLYELIFYYRRDQPLGPWLRARGPLFGLLAVITSVDIWRVKHTPELMITPAYQTQPSVGLWLERVGQYFGVLTANHVPFSPVMGAVLVLALVATGVAFRSRLMVFGVAFYLVTLTPVALIFIRPGYVLYVPEIGLGIWLAGAFNIATRQLPRYQPAFVALVALLSIWFFAATWPDAMNPNVAPEKRLTEQFQRDYPKMSKGAKLLFVTDDFPTTGWDLSFNLQLMYHDPTLVVHRLAGPPDQGPPDRNKLDDYAHVFRLGAGRYEELDRKNVAESVRLNILADYAVGREIDMGRRDHSAYVVSGLMDGDNPDPGRWTEPKSRYKFDIHAEPAEFHAKFWAPDFVTKTGERKLVVLVNGHEVGVLPLKKDGMNEIRFSVPVSAISPGGQYTYVDLNVENPWKDAGGMAFGVILMNAGFDYLSARSAPPAAQQ